MGVGAGCPDAGDSPVEVSAGVTTWTLVIPTGRQRAGMRHVVGPTASEAGRT